MQADWKVCYSCREKTTARKQETDERILTAMLVVTNDKLMLGQDFWANTWPCYTEEFVFFMSLQDIIQM